MAKTTLPSSLAIAHGAELRPNAEIAEMGLGCTNSAVDWIPAICSEIVFMHPTRYSLRGSGGSDSASTRLQR
jgi:hypothetical protein